MCVRACVRVCACMCVQAHICMLLNFIGKDILFLEVLFIIWICISIKTANREHLECELQ